MRPLAVTAAIRAPYMIGSRRSGRCRRRRPSYRWLAGASMRELTAHAGARCPSRERGVALRRVGLLLI